MYTMNPGTLNNEKLWHFYSISWVSIHYPSRKGVIFIPNLIHWVICGNGKEQMIIALSYLNWRLWHHKQLSQVWISNCIQQNSVGCNYLSMPEIPANGAKVPIKRLTADRYCIIVFECDVVCHCNNPYLITTINISLLPNNTCDTRCITTSRNAFLTFYGPSFLEKMQNYIYICNHLSAWKIHVDENVPQRSQRPVYLIWWIPHLLMPSPCKEPIHCQQVISNTSTI